MWAARAWVARAWALGAWGPEPVTDDESGVRNRSREQRPRRVIASPEQAQLRERYLRQTSATVTADAHTPVTDDAEVEEILAMWILLEY